MARLGLAPFLSTPGPRGEVLYVDRAGPGRVGGQRRRWVTPPSQTAVERIGDGRYTRHGPSPTGRSGVPAVGTSPPSRCGPPGRRARSPGPASFFCHYLSVADFAPVDLAVTPLRLGRTVLAQRVEMTQDGRPVLDAMVWSVGQVEGLEHVDVTPPDVSDPADTPPWTPRRQGEDDDEDDDRRPLCVLGQLRATGDRLVGELAAPGTAAAHLAQLGPLQRWRSLHGGRLGAGGPAARRARRRELAGRFAAARPCQSALHCAQPRPLRILPGSDERIELAAARRATLLWPRPVCSRGRAGSGPRRACSWPAVGARRSSVTPEPKGSATRPCSRPCGPGCAT